MPSKIIEVSSANCGIRNSVSFTLMPLIFFVLSYFCCQELCTYYEKIWGERVSLATFATNTEER